MEKRIKPYAVIRAYDYMTKDDFLKHKKEMEKKGYILADGTYHGALDSHEIDDDYYPYKFSAHYIKSDMM